MWISELATKTITADSRMGSHSAANPVMTTSYSGRLRLGAPACREALFPQAQRGGGLADEYRAHEAGYAVDDGDLAVTHIRRRQEDERHARARTIAVLHLPERPRVR